MKKFLSIMLALVLVMSMAVISTTTAFADESTTVYFVNTKNWTTVNAHMWDANGATTAWPGEAMTVVDADKGIYSMDFGTYTSIIFNNGSTQTGDLPISAGQYYEPKTDAWYATADEAITAGGGAVVVDYEYYVTGSMNGWGVNSSYGMTKQADGSYTLTTTLAAGSYQYKVCSADQSTWIPDGMGNDLVINLDVDTEVTFTLADGVVSDSVSNAGGEVTPSSETAPSSDIGEIDFYLFGYINGANYGEMEDSANLGEYKFVNNKVVATFDQDSYVGVKTTAGTYYMTNGWLGTEAKEAVLADSSTLGTEANKLYVPAGTVTFTLASNEDGTYTLSYVEGAEETTAPTTTPKETRPVEVNADVTSNVGIDTNALYHTDKTTEFTVDFALETAELLECGEGSISYNGDVVKLESLEVKNIGNAVVNTTITDIGYFNFTDVNYGDFTSSKVLLSAKFSILKSGNASNYLNVAELHCKNDLVLVEAGAKKGTFTMTATLPTEAKDPSLSAKSKSLKAGQTYTIKVKDADGKKVTYSLSKSAKKYVSVSSKGVVTGLQKGNATITVKVGTKALKFTAKVTSNPKLADKKGKTVSKITVKKGKTAKVYLQGKAKAIKSKFTNTKTAKITSKTTATTLKVKGLKKGSTTLKVKVNGVKTLKLKVVVK